MLVFEPYFYHLECICIIDYHSVGILITHLKDTLVDVMDH
jgi:hypothetical protein